MSTDTVIHPLAGRTPGTHAGGAVRPGSAELAQLLERISVDAEVRDRDRVAPFEQIGWVKAAGLGRLRVPVARAGGAHRARALRHAHRAGRGRLQRRPHPAHALLVRRAAAAGRRPRRPRPRPGLVNADQLVGNGFSEQSKHAGRPALRHHPHPRAGGGYRLNGEKFYSTGSLYSDYTQIWATPDGRIAGAVIPIDREGVTVEDDWDGFGQRLTGTGTTRLRRRATCRRRSSSTSATPTTSPTGLPGRLPAAVPAGRDRGHPAQRAQRRRRAGAAPGAATSATPAPAPPPRTARCCRWSARSPPTPSPPRRSCWPRPTRSRPPSTRSSTALPTPTLAEAAQLAAAQAKVAIDRFSYATAAKLFDVGGASATQSVHNLDRHWRNARTASTHNPTFLKASAIGDHHVNGARFPGNAYF